MLMPSKILVVDDEPQFERLILRRFRTEIKEGLYEFLFARNGFEALEVLSQEQSVDMVLSDIAMPEMDGLTLIARIKESFPLLKTVIVSAYGDIQNIRAAMNQGAFDFITKPIDFTDLKTTIEKTLEEVQLLQQIEQAKELKEKNKKLVALDEFKSRFFTNISHEFRTPLTVISGMTDQIEENPERWLPKGLSMIRRNTHNLLQLVNQILDLRKLESGAMSLDLVQGNIIVYLRYILESFHSLAETKDVMLHFLDNEPEVIMDFDPEKILRIISNLLDNAIKFTNAGGNIYVQTNKTLDAFRIRIKDTGIGIPSKEIPHLFDRFFQLERYDDKKSIGSGIGLSLTKELVQLMDGDIQVESQEDIGTTFIIKLPMRKHAPIHSMENLLSNQVTINQKQNPSISTEPSTSFGKEVALELPSLLIIEDNPDVRQYLSSCLEGLYQLSHASNGLEGVNEAFEKIPDLIISDVMMPQKDGYEVCEELKNDERTSHIPIILLTAKADNESRISGLKKGADAYLAKPFDKRELLVRLEKLLELRNKLQARYSSARKPSNKNPITEPEDQFVLKIHGAVEANLEDENFGILQLCQAVSMSRAQLHRKLKALTGRSTSSFVRLIRLNKAKALLSNTDLNISQVAYEVGFKDPKYFSRTFTEEFGEPPRDMRN